MGVKHLINDDNNWLIMVINWFIIVKHLINDGFIMSNDG